MKETHYTSRPKTVNLWQELNISLQMISNFSWFMTGVNVPSPVTLNKTGSKFSELFQNLLMKHNNNKILLFHENLLATKTKSKAFKPRALFNVLNKPKNLPSKQNLLSKMACPVHQFWVPNIWKLRLYREIDPAE